MKSQIHENLTRMRQMLGLTQQEAAERAGLSLPGYRALETGRSEPRAKTLARLAAAYNVKITDLLAAAPVLQAVRFRAHKTLKRRDRILFESQQWLHAFNQLEAALSLKTKGRFVKLQQAAQAARSPKEAASRVRSAMGLAADEPIRDVCGLVENWGVKVKALPVDSDGYFGLSIGLADEGPAIVVNTHSKIPVERWIFTVAHELAHLLLHLSSFEARESVEIKVQEKEANEFAGYFLMPDQVFLDEWDDTAGLPLVERVMKVKRMFRVSYRTVLYRLIQLGQYDSQLWIDFPKKYRAKTGRTLQRTDEPIGLSPDDFRASEPPIRRAQEPDELVDSDFVEDRFSRLVREAYLENKITLGRAAELLEVPLTEMRVTAAEWA